MTTFHSFIKLTKRLWPALILGISAVGMSPTLQAGKTESGFQDKKGVTEKSRETRKSPDFQQADKNGDRYVTKQELKKDYPYLLKFFDKVDTGEDGRLEEREYENLIMENERDKKAGPI